MAKRRPRGRRVLVKYKIGVPYYYSRVKLGTALALGLKVEGSIPVGKKNHPIRGSMGAKSYTLWFKKLETIDGVAVQSVRFPVSNKVKLIPAYAMFRKIDKLAGITTPNGVSYFWANTQKTGGSLVPLPDLPVQAINIGLDILAKYLGLSVGSPDLIKFGFEFFK
jgi:hypothetical protein